MGSAIIEKNRSSLLYDFLIRRKNLCEAEVGIPVIKRGKGPFLYDYDENRFVDFYLSDGSLFLGHSPPAVTKIIKSWLGRGYAQGYPSVSHDLLARRINSCLNGGSDSIRSHKFFYYNSAFEAKNSLYALLAAAGFKKPEFFLSNVFGASFHCLGPTSIASFDIGKIEKQESVVIQFDSKTGSDSMIELVEKIKKRGALVISDETTFEQHVPLLYTEELAHKIDVRIIGNWISSGLSFGCTIAKKEIFRGVLEKKSREDFLEICQCTGLVPLFTIKAVIKFLEALKKLGGMKGLLRKNKYFFEHLNSDYFHFVNGLIYLKGCDFLYGNYETLRNSLLINGIYFPCRADAPLYSSYTHSEILLKKCSERINLLFEKFYR
jgi:acetylornithine/succinyldiaminopimelate/putrescine aminotransferase